MTIATITTTAGVAGADGAEEGVLLAATAGAEAVAGTDLDDSVIFFDKSDAATNTIEEIQALITAAGADDGFKLASGKKAVILHGDTSDGEQDFDIYYVTGTAADTESMVKVGVVTFADGDAITPEAFGI